MTPAERAIVCCPDVTDTQQRILLHHLDRPELSAAELVEATGRSRRAVFQALRIGRELGLLTDNALTRESAPTCTPDTAVTRESAPTCTPSAPTCTPPEPEQCTQVHQAALVERVTTPPKGGAGQLALVGLVEQPTEQPIEPKPKRQGQPLHHGTGKTRAELRQLAEACRQAREFEGLDTRLWDRQRAEATCAACLRRGMADAELVAVAPKVPTFSLGSIELALNQGATARRTGGVRHAAREDADAKAQRAAAVAEWEAAQAAAKGG